MQEQIKENFDTFVWKLEVQNSKDFIDGHIQKYIDGLCKNDTMQVLLKIDSEVAGIFKIPSGLEELKKEIRECEEENIEIELHIQKNMTQGYLAVYSLEHFIDYISSMPLPDLFAKLSEINNDLGVVRFWVFARKISVETGMIFFSSDKSELLKKKGLDSERRKIINTSMYEVSYVKADALKGMIPQDFQIIRAEGEEEVLRVLNQIALVYCIAYLSNYSEIKEYAISYRLLGYKVLEGEYCVCNMDDISGGLENLYKIINWIYEEQHNIINKYEIVRNILSLHLKDKWVEIEKECYLAIVSSYRIYLKSSVDNYLQIKKEVIEKIAEINDKLLERAKEYTEKVKNNLIAICSFFVSTIVVNTISTGKIENIFTKDICILSYAFLIISVGYIFLNRLELKKYNQELKERYENSKLLYQDIISSEDIDNIYCNDRTYEKTVEMEAKVVKRYTIFWGVANIIIFVAICFLRVTENAV